MLTLYHRTSLEAARAIIGGGFRDGEGTYMTAEQHSGVWFSNVPLDANEGARGDTLLRVRLDLPAEALEAYEWVEEGRDFREFLIPAVVVNPRMAVEIVGDEEFFSDEFWAAADALRAESARANAARFAGGNPAAPAADSHPAPAPPRT